VRDIIVIGAGPAGSVTADHLARAGHDVLILEEHSSVGLPVHCTGLLGDEAFAQFTLPRDLIFARAEAARFWGAGGQSVQVESGGVRASIIDRGGLDAFLARRAESSGAELRRDARVEAVDVSARCVQVRVRGVERALEARAVVVACGANYRFHKPLGLGMPESFLQSAQTEIDFPERPAIEVRFGRTVAPGGFAWLVPFKTGGSHRARIGLMSESRARERFSSLLRALLPDAASCGEPAQEACVEPRLKMLPLAPISRTFGDRVLAVGDAAGLVKPTTGGGIYYGMLSGSMAAEALDDSLRRDRLEARSLAAYERSWRKQLGPEIRTGLRFRKIMARLSDDSIDALIDLATVNGVVPLLQKTASFNWHRKAAMALLGHPAFRHIALKSWTRGARP
jgi:digeranylgeranylglycerophospholipid reductase